MTNLKAESHSYGTVWFDPQAIDPYKSDTFQVQLHNHINIFGCEQVDNLYVLDGKSTLRRIITNLLIPRKCFPNTCNITCPNY